MRGEKIIITKDWCRFKKGDKAVYLEGNDKISRVLFRGQKVWVKNEYFEFKRDND